MRKNEILPSAAAPTELKDIKTRTGRQPSRVLTFMWMTKKAQNGSYEYRRGIEKQWMRRWLVGYSQIGCSALTARSDNNELKVLKQIIKDSKK